MKTLNMILTIVFAISILTVAAQSNSAQRTVSKDVQKIANKKVLSDEQLFTVTSLGYPAWTVSKNVQILNTATEVPSVAGNVPSKGYPFWTISKGDYYRKGSPVKANPVKPGNNLIVKL